MSFRIRISRRAVRDIEQVLAHTMRQFGPRQYERYKPLIRDALADIAADPVASPAKHRPEIRSDARTFHISREGKHAGHFFLYRVVEDRFVDIGRLLHDSMEVRQHLPESFAEPD